MAQEPDAPKPSITVTLTYDEWMELCQYVIAGPLVEPHVKSALNKLLVAGGGSEGVKAMLDDLRKQ